MARLRAFDFPHKALRSIISKFTHMAGTIDYANQHEVADLQKLGAEMFGMLKHHAHTEEIYTFKNIEQKRPGATKFEHDDHERIEEIQNKLEAGLTRGPQNAHDYYLEVSNFQSIYLAHIFHEESVTEQLLWELFTDEELIAERVEIIKNMEPSALMTWFKHGIPASTHAESVGMLNGFKASAPPEAFEMAMNTIQPEMSPTKFEALINALN